MKVLIFSIVLILTVAAVVWANLADKRQWKSLRSRIFKPDAVVKVYTRASKVVDKWDETAEYRIIQTKGDLAYVQSADDYSEYDIDILHLAKYQDKCEVYQNGHLVAQFEYGDGVSAQLVWLDDKI